jgi:hypothetical protein
MYSRQGNSINKKFK